MRSAVTHVIAYGLAYLLQMVAIIAVIGVVNRLLLHEPFFAGWKRGLSMITTFFVVGSLVDLIPHRVQVIINLPVCLVGVGLLVLLLFKPGGFGKIQKPTDTPIGNSPT